MTNPLVVVESFQWQADAAFAKALLEEAGIRAFLVDFHSADIWSGCVGRVRIEVPAADAERAKELLATLRGSHTRPRDAAPDGVERCLACGDAIEAGAAMCAGCGFTFAGEELIQYANGPVPVSLLASAYAPIDSGRFGMSPDALLRYLDWCDQNGLTVRGYELWGRSVVGHQVLQRDERASAADLRRIVGAMDRERAANAELSPTLVKAGAAGKSVG